MAAQGFVFNQPEAGTVETDPGSATGEPADGQGRPPLGSRLEEKTPDAPRRPFTMLRWISVCVGLYLTALLYGLDTTIAADVQGPILESLGEIEKLSWVGIGFPMGSVATILLLGALYGAFEIKWLYLGSIVLFEIGSAVCGSAPSMNALIVGRVIAGIGGAGMYIGCLTYIAVFTNIRERSLYNALIGLCWGAGCILGPVIGGAFAISAATWRWAFYINLVLAAITAPVYIFWFPRFNPQPTVATKRKLAKIDCIGAFLNAAVFTLFMIVLSYAGAAWKWNSGGVITLWVVFGISLIAYVVQQTFSIFTTEKTRLFPVQFVRRRSFVLQYFGTAAAAAGLFVPVYYVPLFFQFTKGDSPIMAAVRLLPFITITITFVMLSGALLPVFGHYMPWYVAAGILMLVGGALMSTVTVTTTVAMIYGFEIVIAAGAGLTQQVGYSVASAKAKPEEVPAALGFINIAQLGSVSIALAISGSIFQNLGFYNLQQALEGYRFSDDELRSALAGAQSGLLSHGDPQVQELATGAIVSTISSIYSLVMAAGALTLVSAIFMRREKLQLVVSTG